MKATLFKTLVYTHRYLGIGLGVLMLMWCLSGLVMVYVSYPELSTPQRVARLPVLTGHQCCVIPSDLFDANVRIETASIEMLGSYPVLRVTPEQGELTLLDLHTGQRVTGISTELAQAAAQAYVGDHSSAATAALLPEVLERDQWTVYPRYRVHRPLYRFDLQDAPGTQLYVSGSTGEVVQHTTRWQRFWNWVGAVPHWLYFTQIRERVALWNNLVTYSSLLGCFLTMLGLALGIWQLRQKRDGRWHSPYRGWKYWHHVPGLVCGILLLSWVFSGLTSMQPWGWLESAGDEATARKVRGDLPDWQTVRASLQQLPAALPEGASQVVMSVQQGQLRYLVQTAAGRVRLDGAWQPAPVGAELWRGLSSLLGEPALTRLVAADRYWYSIEREPVVLPVMRAITSNGTLHYFDMQSGELLRSVDAAAQDYRWWHSALHRLDFVELLRQRPWRDLIMWLFLPGMTAVCLTGVWLGIKRLRR